VPSLLVYLLTMRAIGEDDFPTVRAVVFGGEGFPKPRLHELHRLIGGRVRLINVYGPTECTCICSAYEVAPHDFADLTELAPLGEIAPNFGYYIDPLGDDRACGELLLYGANVGLGYVNDPERTARSFVGDPRNPGFHRVMYRTGDVVRRGRDSLLRFHGRVDNQVKHMGYRIELEEIECALASLSYVREVAVVYRRNQEGHGEIIAFLAPETMPTEEEIAADARRLLPPYMIPRRMHYMDVLPKNRNGKIDRQHLQLWVP
jgi:D-alanine--poly(phosphoribitol) ligase subunit 1